MMTQTESNQWTNKTVVITGASGDIGSAIARRFAKRGANLILHVGRFSPAQKISDATKNKTNTSIFEIEINKIEADCSKKPIYLAADFSIQKERNEFLNQIFEQTEKVDIWIHAAGLDLMEQNTKSLSFSDKLRKIIDVDVISAIEMTRNIGEKMKQNCDGTIFLFSWNGVEHGWCGETAQLYGAAKGALLGFSRSLAESLAPDVRVRCISLGWIQTRWGKTAPPEWTQKVKDDSLAERWGTPDDVAESVMFLAQKESDFVDGIDFRLDGGKRGTTHHIR
ncbi:MAG: SDR family NAD(P)-dependent oxidoreductase [Thermoguttaceae bacterium]